MILVGGKYLEIKASLHLFQESILFFGKDENQTLARSLSENGNNFSLKYHYPYLSSFASHTNQQGCLDG